MEDFIEISLNINLPDIPQYLEMFQLTWKSSIALSPSEIHFWVMFLALIMRMLRPVIPAERGDGARNVLTYIH
jgi:hypothetical protein